MVKLYGREYTREELLDRVDDMSQVGGVRMSRLQHGPEDGVLVVDFNTGSGLRFTVVPSRGMDISATEYGGQSLCPRATAREMHPAFFELGTQGWRRGFMEGMLTTCGPIYHTKPPAPGELRTIKHGRATWTPARSVACDEAWAGDRYLMWATGKMREGALVWERTVRTELGATSFTVHDRVENQGRQPIGHRFQYHINAGFPVVDEGAEFTSTSLGLWNRRGQAVDPAFRTVEAPSYDNQGGAHDELMCADENGYAYAVMCNRTFREGQGLGYYIKYGIETLPFFVLWKSAFPDRYVMGTEPTSHMTVDPQTMDPDRLAQLQPLAGGAVRDYEIEIGVLPDNQAIDAMVAHMGELVADYCAHPTDTRIGNTHTGRHGY